MPLPSTRLPQPLGAASAALPQGASGYAGDVTGQQADQSMRSGDAVLIDVRTDAEAAKLVSVAKEG